jgi:hypothetical protein
MDRLPPVTSKRGMRLKWCFCPPLGPTSATIHRGVQFDVAQHFLPFFKLKY